MPFSITAATAMLDITQSGATGAMSVAFTSTLFLGLYSATSDSLSIINSVSLTFGFAANNTNNSTGFAGVRFLSIASSLWSASPAFAQGSNYYMAAFFLTAGTQVATGSILGRFQYNTTNASRNGSIGVLDSGATPLGQMPFLGGYSTTTNALPATIGNSEIRKTQQNDFVIPHVVLNNRPALAVY